MSSMSNRRKEVPSSTTKAERSSSLQDLFNQSTTLFQDINLVKENRLRGAARSFSSQTLTGNMEDSEDSHVANVSLCDEMQRGCKRSFEHSVAEHVRNIGEYCLKRKRQEEYWRRIV